MLTPRQTLFVQEYLIDFNGRRAVGVVWPNMSEDSAYAYAGKLLRLGKIADAIDEAVEIRAGRIQVRGDEVLRELAFVAFSDIGDLIDFSGPEPRMKSARTISKKARKCISSYKVRRERVRGTDPPREVEVVEFKLWNKIDALEKLGRHLGLWKDREPLEVLLGFVNPEVAGVLRGLLAQRLADRGSPAGSNGANGHS